MTSELASPQAALLDAAGIVARGRDLDAKLAALAGHAAALSGAPLALIAFFDAASATLVPAAVHGTAPEGLADTIIALDEASDPVAAALLERRSEVSSGPDGEVWQRTTALLPGLGSISVHPLVVVDDSGTDELQGAIICGYAADSSSPNDPAILGAIADLTAVAIRQAQLEYALQERADWLERMAHTDALTGLANRRTFERMLELELARAARQGTQLSLAVFDIDGLRTITEQSGGRTGDDVLRQVASTLAEQVRLVDTVARIGADEFAVIAPGALGGIVARRVRDAVAEMATVGETRVSVSAGVAHFPAEGSSAAELLAAAEQAVAEAQRQGAGTVIATGEPEPDAAA